MLTIVNSFDIFDTLIGRICGDPDSVFDIVGEKAGYPNYKHIRKLSENKSDGTWDSIWENFKALSMLSIHETETLMRAEWETEKFCSFPIITNNILLKPKDILVSDMYLLKNMIIELLNINNIHNYSKIYVTPSGKRKGFIWNTISEDGYIIDKHTGDSPECDLLSPKKYKIRTQFFNKDYNESEKYLLNNGYKKLANLCRIIRLSNPYSSDKSNEHIMWHELSRIIPILSIIFNCSNQSYYIHNLLDLYDEYTNNFVMYYNTNPIYEIKKIQKISEKYMLKLQIDKTNLAANKNLVEYSEIYGRIRTNDIL